MIAISVFFLFLTSLTHADCVCTPLTYYCADGYENTCLVVHHLFCDSINITTNYYELTQKCIDSNNKVPYLEIYAKFFTLQDNFFKTSGGIHFKKTDDHMFWDGFNNFEQINEVTYVDSFFYSPVDFNMDTTFTLSGDAIFEFGNISKGGQILRFDTATTTLRDESILNISTSSLWDPKEFILYNNSKLISAAFGRNNNNGKFYFCDSSSLVLDECQDKIYMPFIHYFYDNSILQFERDTNSYLKQVYLYDTSLLNISESSFIRFGSFSLSSTASVEIGEDSVIQTPLSSLNGEITFNNKARLNSKTSTTSLQSSLSLNVIETIIGYPIISLWNETSMLSNINEIIYNSSECIDVYSFASSNDDLKLPSKYYQLANNQLIRYCPSSVDYDVHCYLNTSIWNSSFIDDNNYPIFISPHCMNSNYSNYLYHSIQNTFEVGNDPINITFAEILDTIIISEQSSNQQIINGSFNTIETSFGLKINTNQNTKSTTLKSEVIEPNTFIEIETSTTINTNNYEIQLDLTSLTSNSNSTYILNATIIEIIDDSNVTLDYSTPYIQFINSNNYQFYVDFTQNEILLYSENGFDIKYGNICYYTYELTSNYECIPTHCNDINCTSCEDGYVLDQNGKCNLQIENCLITINNDCVECSNDLYPSKQSCKIIKEQTPTNGSSSEGPAKTPSPGCDQQGGISRVAHARLQKDFSEYEPIPGCIFEQSQKGDFTKYKLSISPMEGMYESGKWNFTIECPRDYPNNPPKATCITPIYHPNIDLEGHVCLSILRVDKDWSPVTTLNHVVCGILSLFLDPNPNDPLNTEAGETMKRDLNEFIRMVNKTMRGGRFFNKDFPRLK
ncbi:hypothetical protein QTN25_004798 [Entamoeba marina]